jgi:hypothetical protein
MSVRALLLTMFAATCLAACNPAQPPADETGGVLAGEEGADAQDEARPELPPVDAALLEAPNTDFVAIEPTEMGVIGSPDIREALGPLVSAETLGEGEVVQLSVRETGETAVADIVRTGLADDAVSGGHVRIEFHREEDGWFPTNAYRRQQCRRGASAGAWTTAPCP